MNKNVLVKTQLALSGARWRNTPYSGPVVVLLGTALITGGIALIGSDILPFPLAGFLYLPFVAFLAYYRRLQDALLAAFLQLLCVYLFFLAPVDEFKNISLQHCIQFLILIAVTGFVLFLVQPVRQRRTHAEQAALHLAELNRMGQALSSELEEEPLLHLIAETACNLTGAGFAAFTLRPIDEFGQPVGPSEGQLFHLAAIVGVTPAQEQMFKQRPLGGEGLLAPIFRQGVPIRIDDAIDYFVPERHTSREQARQAATNYAHGYLPKEGLQSLGVPKGHLAVRSFLGVPLLDRNRQVRGGVLLGHKEAGRFTQEHEQLLVGLAAQAAIAIENARLYRITHIRAQELDAIFSSITDGVILVDRHGHILRENQAALQVHERLQAIAQEELLTALITEPVQRAIAGEPVQNRDVTVGDQVYLVSASLLRTAEEGSPDSLAKADQRQTLQKISGVVITWHDVTETRNILVERSAHSETEARRALLQLVLDELPSSVYLVRGRDARLVLANHAATTVWGAVWHYEEPMQQFLQDNAIRIFGTDGLPLAQEQLATIRAVQYGETVLHQQEVIRHSDGVSLPVLVNAVALNTQILRNPVDAGFASVEDDGEPLAIVVHQDVTALKDAEQMKDEFIGIAAHELRTPLAVLKGFANLLFRQVGQGNGPELADWQLDALQGIDQATLRLIELTEDLLDVTRLQAGRLALHIIATDLVALVKRMMKRLQPIAEKHTFSLHATAEHIIVDVDARRMEQVIGNLINNALKYSPDDGTIQINICEEQVTQIAQISIHDHGIGIPAAQQAQMFGRFIRADNAREQGISGTGLGLYLCRELIERQRGKIWFESTEGVESTFFVALPLHVDVYEVDTIT